VLIHRWIVRVFRDEVFGRHVVDVRDVAHRARDDGGCQRPNLEAATRRNIDVRTESIESIHLDAARPTHDGHVGISNKNRTWRAFRSSSSILAAADRARPAYHLRSMHTKIALARAGSRA
jgi:hypothetical protein